MKRIPVGRVISTHGLKGEIKFKYYNEVDDDIYRYTSFLAKKSGSEIILNPASVKPHKRVFRIHFQGLDSVEEVSFLMNQELFVREEDLPGLDHDEYYEYQLIGLDVVNEKDEKIGRVESIMHGKGNDVMVVAGDEEIFVPMMEEYILAVNLEGSFVKIRQEDLLV
jgi:16S rRNA processing protein RimM